MCNSGFNPTPPPPQLYSAQPPSIPPPSIPRCCGWGGLCLCCHRAAGLSAVLRFLLTALLRRHKITEAVLTSLSSWPNTLPFSSPPSPPPPHPPPSHSIASYSPRKKETETENWLKKEEETLHTTRHKMNSFLPAAIKNNLDKTLSHLWNTFPGSAAWGGIWSAWSSDAICSNIISFSATLPSIDSELCERRVCF